MYMYRYLDWEELGSSENPVHVPVKKVGVALVHFGFSLVRVTNKTKLEITLTSR